MDARKQKNPALSSTEAEYVASAEAGQELLCSWLQKLMKGVDETVAEPIINFIRNLVSRNVIHVQSALLDQ